MIAPASEPASSVWQKGTARVTPECMRGHARKLQDAACANPVGAASAPGLNAELLLPLPEPIRIPGPQSSTTQTRPHHPHAWRHLDVRILMQGSVVACSVFCAGFDPSDTSCSKFRATCCDEASPLVGSLSCFVEGPCSHAVASLGFFAVRHWGGPQLEPRSISVRLTALFSRLFPMVFQPWAASAKVASAAFMPQSSCHVVVLPVLTYYEVCPRLDLQ